MHQMSWISAQGEECVDCLFKDSQKICDCVPHIEMLKNLDLQVGIRGETPLTDKLSWWKEQNACLLGAS